MVYCKISKLYNAAYILEFGDLFNSLGDNVAQVRTTVTIPIGKEHQHQAEFVSFRELTDEKEHIALVFKAAD